MTPVTITDHGALGIGALAVGGAAAIVALPLIAIAAPTMVGHGDTECHAPQPSASAAASIPADYLARYKAAGKTYGLSWQLLAAIGRVESDHGRGTGPGIRSGHNHAGAMGPMQFLNPTWSQYGVDADRDGRRNAYDPDDAIPAAARYLRHQGAPADLRKALLAYNPSFDYVRLVLHWAATYASAKFTADCTDASPSTGAQGAAGRIIAFAMAQRGKRYVLGAEGPDAWDCSSLVQAAYRAAGLSIPRTTFQQWPFGVRIPKGTEQPGDLVFFNTGPNTAPGRPGHVGLVTAPGKMVAARCSTCQPNIGIQSYRTRNDWVGSTRPLLKFKSQG